MTVAGLNPSTGISPAFRVQTGTDPVDGAPLYENHYLFSISTASWGEVDGSLVVANPDPARTYVEAEVGLSFTQFGIDVDSRNDNQAVTYVQSQFDVYPPNFDTTDAAALQREIDAIRNGQFDQLPTAQVEGTIEQWIDARVDGTGTLYVRFYASYVSDPPRWEQPGIRVRFGGYSSHWSLDSSFGQATNVVEDAEFDPNGGWFSYCSRDMNIYVHGYGGTWPHSQTLTKTGEVTGLSTTSTGALLASVDNGGSCVVHNTSDWTVAQTFTDGALSHTRCVGFSPDDAYLAYGADPTGVHIRNTSDWTVATTTGNMTDTARGAAWSTSYLAVGSKDFNVYVYDWTWTLVQTITAPAGVITGLDFSVDEAYLSITSADGNVYIVNTSDWTTNHTIAAGTPTRSTAFLSDRFLAFGHDNAAAEAHTYDPVNGWPHDNTFTEPASRSFVSEFSGDGVYFAAGDYGTPYNVHLYNTPPAPTTVTGPAVTLDGTAVQGAEIAVIHNDTGAVLGETTTDASGNWSITVDSGQTVHAFAEYEDANGNLYQESSKPFVAT